MAWVKAQDAANFNAWFAAYLADIRVTVILASVLFLVGISSHFPLRGVRIGLVTAGAVLLLFAAVQILQLPGPRPEGKYADHPVRTT